MAVQRTDRSVLPGEAAAARGLSLTRRTALLGPLATFLVPMTPAVAQARRVHSLVVGINAYRGRSGTRDRDGRMANLTAIPVLRGCINDAQVIEAALRPLSASIRVLLDGQATRQAIISSWRQLVAGAARGDLAIFTFSGHGAQQPERVPGNEEDGQDEFFVLGGFDATGLPGNQQQILDDEIGVLLAEAGARGVDVIFVADCCHAGTMTRSVDSRVQAGVSYRTIQRTDVEGALADPLALSSTRDPAPPNVLYLSGSLDGELVPEVMINGRYQGALSLAFAEAISGRGVDEREGHITADSLARHVLRAVRLHADSGQHPDVRWPTPEAAREGGMRPNTVLIRPPGAPPVVAVPAPAPSDVRIAIRGTASTEDRRRLAALGGVALVEAGSEADLTWDAASGDVLNAAGNIVRHGARAGDIGRVIERQRALLGLRRLAAQSGLDMRLRLLGEPLDAPPSVESDRIHPAGTQLELVVSGLRFPHFTLFNLAGDGTVQFLFPMPGQRHAPIVRTDRPQVQRFQVTPPFGADHAVAVAGAADSTELVRALGLYHDKQEPMAAFEAVERYARGGSFQVGLQGLYTRARG